MRLSQIANELLYYGSNFGWPRNLGLENGQAGGGIPYLRSGHPTIDMYLPA